MVRMVTGLLLAAAAAFGFTWQPNAGAVAAVRVADQPVEAGAVVWSRDLDASLKRSKETGKPIFLLFQEVPG
jgi:hypothetical protein